MAMVKPIALKVSAFDANNAQFFSFISTGGNQVVKNKLTIRNNETNAIVYENTVETFAFGQTVPENTLENGKYYNFYFNTYDVNENVSEDSNAIAFRCYTTPTLQFTNIPNNNVISNASYNFEVTYNQIEGELLDSIIVKIYDSVNNELATSKNLYNTNVPPLKVDYFFDGFENNEIYKIQAFGITIEGTTIESQLTTLFIEYTRPVLFSGINLENHCDEGYNLIKTNFKYIEGQSYPETPTYIENTYVDLRPKGYNVNWYQGFVIDNNFILQMWLKPSNLGEICRLYGDNPNNYINVSFCRGIPVGETTTKDYIKVSGYVNGQIKLNQISQYYDSISSNSYVVVWVKKENKTWSIVFDIVENTNSFLHWNGNSNVYYSRLTNQVITKSDVEHINEVIINEEEIYNIFPLKNVTISNGLFDFIDITDRITRAYSRTYPTWDYCTILNCDFDNNINGGNTSIVLSQIDSLKLKRRVKGTLDWIVLLDKKVKTIEDIEITYIDPYIKNNIEFEYAVIPSIYGVEGEFFLSSIKTFVNGTFLSDKTTIFKLYFDVGYGEIVQNRPKGVLQPIGQKYPIIVENADNLYKTGSISATLLGYNFEKNRYIDRADSTKQGKDFMDFINNGLAKYICDWNGNAWIIKPSSTPSVTPNQTYGNGFGVAKFSWVEKGVWNNQEDLYMNGLIDVI